MKIYDFVNGKRRIEERRLINDVRAMAIRHGIPVYESTGAEIDFLRLRDDLTRQLREQCRIPDDCF